MQPVTASGPRSASLAALLLLGLLALQALTSMTQKSVTVDEITYLTAGTYHARTGDFHYNQTNPPLMKMVAGLPLLVLGAELPTLNESPRNWSQIQQWQFARRFLYESRRDADTILLAARLPSVAISLLLGWLVFAWSRRLYGAAAGLLALSLYCLSPNILAHSRLATQDIGLSAAVFAGAYFSWRSIRSGTLGWIALSGACLGLGVAIKTPFVFALVAFAGYGLWCVLRDEAPPACRELPLLAKLAVGAGLAGRPARAISLLFVFAGAGLVALFLLNACYGFQGTLSSLGEQVPALAASPRTATSVLYRAALELPVPLPSAYVEGLHFQTRLQGSSGSVYFAGEVHDGGLWYLTLVSLLLKVPIPILLLFAAALWQLFVRRRALESERLLLLVIACFLLAFTWLSHMGGHVRYVLPVFPFCFVLIGGLLAPGRATRPIARMAIGVAVAWTAIAAWSTHPHYLTYFNELIGGPKNGYRYLAGSNVDWGQDLKGLRRYMDERGIERIQLAYFGSADAAYHGIRYDYLPSVGLAPTEPGQYWWYELDSPEKRVLTRPTGLVAVSATLLASPQWMHRTFGGMYGWLQEHEPIDQIGHSILIYHIDE